MIPPWLQRCFERCESCCLDNEDDRRRLALAIADEMPVTPDELVRAESEIVSLRIALRMVLELETGREFRSAEHQAVIREARKILEGGR